MSRLGLITSLVAFTLSSSPVVAAERGALAQSLREQAATLQQPTGQNMSEAQQQNVATLKKELESIKQGSTVTPEQKTALKVSLQAVAEGAVKPSEASVKALSDALAEAKADGAIDPEEAMTIARSMVTVLDSANVSQEEAQAAIKATQAVLESSGVEKSDVETVARCMKVIYDEVQVNVAAAKAKAADVKANTDTRGGTRRQR